MTERQTTTKERDEAVTPHDGVGVFDANAAKPTPSRSTTDTNFKAGDNNRTGYSGIGDNDTRPTDLGTTAAGNVNQGASGNKIWMALVIIIVIALLLYWIF